MAFLTVLLGKNTVILHTPRFGPTQATFGLLEELAPNWARKCSLSEPGVDTTGGHLHVE